MKPIIVTIGRQFGSGGHEIGEKLAKRLNIPFYDKELLAAAAERSGMSKEMLQSYDEQPTNSFLYSLSVGTYTLGSEMQLPLNNQVFLAMTDAIRGIAAEGSCVIVGRCADYVLNGNPALFRVFVHADMDARVGRIKVLRELSNKEAAALIQKTDKKRANYHNFYSDDKWGVAQSYDITLNSAKLGVDGAVEMLAQYAEQR